MKNDDLPMSYRLWKNEARRLLRKVLQEMRYCSEGDLLLDAQHKQECKIKGNYNTYNEQGKLLNEIDLFLNKKASLMNDDFK